MSDPVPPYGMTDEPKYDGSKRTKRQIPVLRFSQKKLQRIVLKQGIRYDIGAELQDAPAVDIYGVFAV